jgi:adenylosuccinate synthase
VVGRYTAEINGLASAAITRFDILDTFPAIKICTAYKVGTTTYHRPPANLGLFERCQPVYEEMPGWQTPTSDIRSFKKLPPQAKAT